MDCFSKIEVNGVQPAIEGEVCERLLIVQSWLRGEISEPATTVHFLIQGRWHCFFIDCGIFHWRSDRGEPQNASAPELNTEWRVEDLGAVSGFEGLSLDSIQFSACESGGEARFLFEGGKALSIINENDCTRHVC